MMGLTIALGLAFVVVKVFEYGSKYEHHLIPGINFTWTGEHAAHVEMFFVLYFIMTLIHAAHVVVGLGLFVWIILLAQRGEYTHAYSTPVAMVGLYWHFVDVVWIVIFTLVYLIQ